MSDFRSGHTIKYGQRHVIICPGLHKKFNDMKYEMERREAGARLDLNFIYSIQVNI